MDVWERRDNNIQKGENIIICLSGRGDKDIDTVEDFSKNEGLII